MKQMFFKFIFLIAFTCIFAACNSNSVNNNKETSDSAKVRQLVYDWNKEFISNDSNAFLILLDDSIQYYGFQQYKSNLMEAELLIFKKYPDFKQEIYGDVKIDTLSKAEAICSFVRRITINHKSLDYPTYLIFKKSLEAWKIVAEGDYISKNDLTNKSNIPKDAVLGDYNGDGKLDYMWLVPPKIKSGNEEFDCVGECDSYIKFSDTSLSLIKIENCIGGQPFNHGDLNKNGTDEIGLLPEWFTSCWSDYLVWTFRNGKWIYAVEPFPTHCNQWEEGVIPIEIDFKKEGYVIIRYSEFSEKTDNWTKSKSVKIIK